MACCSPATARPRVFGMNWMVDGEQLAPASSEVKLSVYRKLGDRNMRPICFAAVAMARPTELADPSSTVRTFCRSYHSRTKLTPTSSLFRGVVLQDFDLAAEHRAAEIFGRHLHAEERAFSAERGIRPGQVGREADTQGPADGAACARTWPGLTATPSASRANRNRNLMDVSSSCPTFFLARLFARRLCVSGRG